MDVSYMPPASRLWADSVSGMPADTLPISVKVALHWEVFRASVRSNATYLPARLPVVTLRKYLLRVLAFFFSIIALSVQASRSRNWRYSEPGPSISLSIATISLSMIFFLLVTAVKVYRCFYGRFRSHIVASAIFTAAFDLLIFAFLLGSGIGTFTQEEYVVGGVFVAILTVIQFVLFVWSFTEADRILVRKGSSYIRLESDWYENYDDDNPIMTETFSVRGQSDGNVDPALAAEQRRAQHSEDQDGPRSNRVDLVEEDGNDNQRTLQAAGSGEDATRNLSSRPKWYSGDWPLTFKDSIEEDGATSSTRRPLVIPYNDDVEAHANEETTSLLQRNDGTIKLHDNEID